MNPSSVVNPYRIPVPEAPPLSEEDLSIGANIRKGIGRTVVWGAGLLGGARYGVMRLAKHFFPEMIPSEVRFLPYMLNGACIVFIGETAKLSYLIALKFLGERPQTGTIQETDARLDRLRGYSWKVIFYVEGLQKRIDQQFSKVCRIRTLEQIKREKIENRHLFYLEIFRRALIDQIKESAQMSVSVLSFSFAALVFPVIGGQVLTALAVANFALSFFHGLVNKFALIIESGLDLPNTAIEQPQNLPNPDPVPTPV